MVSKINQLFGIPELASEHGELVDHMLGFVHWFMLILFVAEPLVIHPMLRREGRDGRWHGRLQTMHYALSVLGLLTIAGAVAGAHGWMP